MLLSQKFYTHHILKFSSYKIISRTYNYKLTKRSFRSSSIFYNNYQRWWAYLKNDINTTIDNTNYKFQQQVPREDELEDDGWEHINKKSLICEYLEKKPFQLSTLKQRVDQLLSKYSKSHHDHDSIINININEEEEEIFINDIIKSFKLLQKQLQTRNFNHDDSQIQLQLQLKSNKIDDYLIFNLFNDKRVNFTFKILRYYLLTSKSNSSSILNSNYIIESIKCLINRQQNIEKQFNSNKDTIFLALRLILKQNDFELSFELMNLTFGNSKYFKYIEENTNKIKIILPNQKWIYPVVPSISLFLIIFDSNFQIHLTILSYLILNSLFYFNYIYLNILSINNYLIHWRPGLSSFEKFKKINELKMIRKILIEFDENLNLSVANYHLKFKEIDIDNNYNPFALSLPSSSPLTNYNEYEQLQVEKMEKIRKLIDQELVKRKMRLSPTDEELMFQEYWSSYGEGFEWVEPDKDPTEYVNT